MARFDKIAVLNKIGSTGMVPVFYHKDAAVAGSTIEPTPIAISGHSFAAYFTTLLMKYSRKL